MSQTNRRVSIRRPARNSTKVRCLLGRMGFGKNIALELLNLSETGARARLSTSLEKGREVELSLMGVEQLRPIVRTSQVVRVEEDEDGTFIVGLAFEKRLSHAEAQSLTRSR